RITAGIEPRRTTQMTMNPNTKRYSFCSQLLVAGCIIGLGLAPRVANAQVSEADFKALKEAVQKLSEQVQKFEQAHQKDQDQIKQLQEKLGETQTAAADAVRKAEVATQMQPVYRVPDDSGSVNKNFLILGDA